jgi:hypothetical protein
MDMLVELPAMTYAATVKALILGTGTCPAQLCASANKTTYMFVQACTVSDRLFIFMTNWYPFGMKWVWEMKPQFITRQSKESRVQLTTAHFATVV